MMLKIINNDAEDKNMLKIINNDAEDKNKWCWR